MKKEAVNIFSFVKRVMKNRIWIIKSGILWKNWPDCFFSSSYYEKQSIQKRIVLLSFEKELLQNQELFQMDFDFYHHITKLSNRSLST